MPDLVSSASSDLVDPDKPAKETTKTTSKRPATSRSKAAQLDGIKPTMVSGWVMVGGAVSMVVPLTGKAMIYQAEELTDSLIAWGKTSPRIAKILLTGGKTTGAFAFLTASAPVGIALLVELGRMSPDLGKRLLPEELHEFIPNPKTEWPEGEDPNIVKGRFANDG